MLASRSRIVLGAGAEGESHNQGLAVSATAANEPGQGQPRLIHDLEQVTLDRPLADAEPLGDLPALDPGAVEGKNVALAAGERGSYLADQHFQIGVVLQFNQLLGGAAIVGDELAHRLLAARIDGDFATVALRLMPEAAIGRGANPGIDLTGVVDAFGFVQK